MDADNKYKQGLLKTAREKYKGYEIIPCGTALTLDEGFTRCGKILMFWFNTTRDNSTRMVHTLIDGAS